MLSTLCRKTPGLYREVEEFVHAILYKYQQRCTVCSR